MKYRRLDKDKARRTFPPKESWKAESFLALSSTTKLQSLRATGLMANDVRPCCEKSGAYMLKWDNPNVGAHNNDDHKGLLLTHLHY